MANKNSETKRIVLEDIWNRNEGRTPPADSEIVGMNARASHVRDLSLKNLQAHRIDTINAFRAKYGSVPDALAMAFDGAREYISGLPLIWWHKGTVKGSVAHIDTTGRGMFLLAAKSFPEIKSHMDVVRGILAEIK